MSGDVLILPQPYKPGACQLNLCDGSGFIVDEVTNTASDCRCRAAQIAKRRTSRTGGTHPEPLPGHLL